MTAGGARGSPNGQTSQKRSLCSKVISNRIFRLTSASMTCACEKPGAIRSRLRSNMALTDFAITTTGSPASAYYICRWMICWLIPKATCHSACAGRTKTGRGVGTAAEHEVLIAQEYRPGDDLDFIKSLIPFFQDKRYMRVDGKPYFCVYRPPHLPDVRKSLRVWRDYCRTIGLGEIHISAALTHGNEEYASFGFDSGVEFPPHNLEQFRLTTKSDFLMPFTAILCSMRQ